MAKLVGLLFFFSGAILLMGITTAEIFYPHYSISLNMISNLGSTPPPTDVVLQPSATIFDYSLVIAGGLVVIGGALLQKLYRRRQVTIPTIIMGAGVMGVGVFPAFHVLLHPLVALIAFLGGGLAAIFTATLAKAPFKYIHYGLGIVSIGFLLLGLFMPEMVVPLLGSGGVERWVAYPLILWLVGFGGYLMASK